MIQPGGYIRDILDKPIGEKVTAHGWVKTKTEFPAHYFVKLNDGSCFDELQLVVKKGSFVSDDVLAKITTGACLVASGTIVESGGKGQRIDLEVESLELLGAANPEEYYLQKKRVSLARMWLAPAPLWLLDEPYANLDLDGINLVNRMISAHLRGGGAALVTTHGAYAAPPVRTRMLELGVAG